MKSGPGALTGRDWVDGSPEVEGRCGCVKLRDGQSAKQGINEKPRSRGMESSNVQGNSLAPNGVEIESEGKVQQGRSTSGVRNFFAGGFGGVCGVTIGHPFDTIKVRIF